MKKLSNFDEEQAELITARIIQKITIHSSHLRRRKHASRQHRTLSVFQIGLNSSKSTSTIEEKYTKYFLS
jgi:hypothetical protein